MCVHLQFRTTTCVLTFKQVNLQLRTTVVYVCVLMFKQLRFQFRTTVVNVCVDVQGSAFLVDNNVFIYTRVH